VQNCALSQLPYAPTTLTIHCTRTSRFLCNFFPRMAPQFFCHHHSPSNLAESHNKKLDELRCKLDPTENPRSFEKYPTPPREHGLPIRDCAKGCNNFCHARLQMNARDVTKKILFERLYLVAGMGTFGLRVNCPYATTNLTVHHKNISRFWCAFFPRMAPHFVGHHDLPSNLAESRYRHPTL